MGEVVKRSYFDRNQLISPRARDVVVGQFRWTMDPITVGTLLDALAEAESQIKELRTTIAEVGHSAVSFEDKRVDYIEVQIDRELWESIRKPDWAVGP